MGTQAPPETGRALWPLEVLLEGFRDTRQAAQVGRWSFLKPTTWSPHEGLAHPASSCTPEDQVALPPGNLRSEMGNPLWRLGK